MIECRTDVYGSNKDSIIGDILANQIGQTVAENVRAWRRSGQHTGATQRQEGDLQIGCDLVETDGQTNIFIKIVHLPTGQILYSKLHALEHPGDVLNSAVPIAAIVFEAADRVIGKLAPDRRECPPRGARDGTGAARALPDVQLRDRRAARGGQPFEPGA